MADLNTRKLWTNIKLQVSQAFSVHKATRFGDLFTQLLFKIFKLVTVFVEVFFSAKKGVSRNSRKFSQFCETFDHVIEICSNVWHLLGFQDFLKRFILLYENKSPISNSSINFTAFYRLSFYFATEMK